MVRRFTPLIALLLAACGSAQVGSVSSGVWGGNGISLNVTPSGASATFFCATGTISQPLTLDASGHFDVPGLFHSVAILESDQARYTGSVNGNNMQLTVNNSQGTSQFNLSFGATGSIRVCNE